MFEESPEGLFCLTEVASDLTALMKEARQAGFSPRKLKLKISEIRGSISGQNLRKAEKQDLLEIFQRLIKLLKLLVKALDEQISGSEPERETIALIEEIEAMVLDMLNCSPLEYKSSVVRHMPHVISIVVNFCRDFMAKQNEEQPCFQSQRKWIKSVFDHAKSCVESFVATISDHQPCSSVIAEMMDKTVLSLSPLHQLEFNAFAKMIKAFFIQFRVFLKMKAGSWNIESVISLLSALGMEHLDSVDNCLKEGNDMSGLVIGHKKLTFVIKAINEVLNSDMKELDGNLQPLIELISRLLQGNKVDILNQENLRPDVKTQLLDSLPGWGRTLLSKLVNLSSFQSLVLGRECNQVDTYGFLLIIGYTFHLLAEANSDELRQRWIFNDSNLFHALLESIQNFYIQFLPHVKVVEVGSANHSLISPYEQFITLVQSYVMGAQQREMEVLEHELFVGLANSCPVKNFWKVKIITDLWSFIARYGPASLCQEHVTALAELYVQHENPAVGMLLERMSTFSSAQGVKELQEKYPPSESKKNLKLWSMFHLDHCSTTFLNEVFTVAAKEVDQFVQGSHKDMPSLIFAIISLGKVMASLTSLDMKRVQMLVSKLWQKLSQGHFVATTSSPCVIFMKSLCFVTKAVVENLDSVEPILKSMETVARAANENYIFYLFAEIITHKESPPKTWQWLLQSSIADPITEAFTTWKFLQSSDRSNKSRALSREIRTKVDKFDPKSEWRLLCPRAVSQALGISSEVPNSLDNALSSEEVDHLCDHYLLEAEFHDKIKEALSQCQRAITEIAANTQENITLKQSILDKLEELQKH